MTVLAQLRVLLQLDADEYAADIKRVQRETARWGRKMERMGKALTVGVTAPLVAMGTMSVKAASDLNEAMNKVEVVFGSAAGEVEDFGKTAAQSVGLSQRAALEAAGTFGNLFTTIGMGKKPAADMSVSLVKLAADLASFNNLNPEDVLEKLRSGLVGEVEPLRSLGINLNQAAVQAKAMEMGLADANGQVSQAAMIQARYALILEQTKNAQGDFQRTSGALANSTRILRAEFEDARASLGQELLPVAIDAVHVFNDMLATFGAMPQGTRKMVVGFGAMAAAAGPAAMAVGKTAQAVSELSKAIAAAGGMKAWLTTAGGVAAKANLAALAVASWGVMIYKVVQTGKSLQTGVEGMNKAYRAHEIALRATAQDYDAYIREMARAYRVVHRIAPSQEELVEILKAGGPAAERWRKEMGVLTETEWEHAHVMAVEAESYDRAMLASAGYTNEIYAAAAAQIAVGKAAQEAAAMEEAYRQKLDLLQQALQGPVSQAYEEYQQKVADLRDRMAEVQQEITELQGKTWLSDDDKARLADLREEYGQLQQAMDDTTAAYQRQRAEIVYNMASKMMMQAVDQGLIQDLNQNGTVLDEVYDALTKVAQAFGLVDDATAKTQQKVSELTMKWINGQITQEQYIALLKETAGAMDGAAREAAKTQGAVEETGGALGESAATAGDYAEQVKDVTQGMQTVVATAPGFLEQMQVVDAALQGGVVNWEQYDSRVVQTYNDLGLVQALLPLVQKGEEALNGVVAIGKEGLIAYREVLQRNIQTLGEGKTVLQQVYEKLTQWSGALQKGLEDVEAYSAGLGRLKAALDALPRHIDIVVSVHQEGGVPAVGGGGSRGRGGGSGGGSTSTGSGGAYGGSAVVRRPTVFLAGERGVERVDITPLPRLSWAPPPGAGHVVVVNFHYAPTVSLADEVEMERVLGPFVAEKVRAAVAEAM